MWLAVLALSLNAAAHPSGATNPSDPNGGMPGQRLEAQVEPGHLRIDYYVEIAAMRLYKEARAEGAAGAEWAPKHAESLRPGVRARWNDVELELTPLAVEKPAQLKEASYVELHLAGEAALPEAPGSLQLRMDNYPDEPCYYAVSVALAGALVVTETDLGHVAGGRLRDNRHGAWRRDEDGRSTNVSLRPAHFWESQADGPLPERLEGLVPSRVSLGALAAAAAGVALGVAVGVVWWRRRAR
ncbi:hypothetical protein LBMAG42_37120 [Deltaproteobacteria bacterium]|nr:hypothetical protein LBMAG42_37120 [Deltaproteobacteria bacterium]